MPRFLHMPGLARRHDGDAKRNKPFPATSTFLLMAAAFIVLWLLAVGLPKLSQIQSEPVSRTSIDAGASK